MSCGHKMSEFITLGIESSCDETAVAVVADGTKIRSNIISSQLDIHARFGGVVPELAARCHLEAVRPIYDLALKEAGLDLDQVNLVAATAGPGLVGCLLVGLSFAKGLALAKSNSISGGQPHRRAYLRQCLGATGGSTALGLSDGLRRPY